MIRMSEELERFKGKILALIDIVEDNLVYWMDSDQSERGNDAIRRIRELCEKQGDGS